MTSESPPETSTLRRRRRWRPRRSREVTEVAPEETTDERSAELLWRRMEDNIDTASTSSNSSSQSTSAAFRPSPYRKEAGGFLTFYAGLLVK